ncbi:cupin domain-containing protein [Castellaniella sp. FW104-16D08]|uniref:cupin domain-containing protein n=1 Tax=unclassified Castellaniella TaxID=2617606 RepID=UPI003314DF06
MLINADFSRRASVTSQQYQWITSPQGGVERVMLDRVGAEKARATSIVRYAPDSCFPNHKHPEGEEILVLSGTFSDESGDFPAGWYLRNPPGSGHKPFSRDGATIFVKLRQMAAGDRQRVRIDTQAPSAWQRNGDSEICPLFSDHQEKVCLQRVSPNQPIPTQHTGGLELLVLSGEVLMDEQHYAQGSWIRLPMNDTPVITTGAQGATIYLKTGHLASITARG